MDCPGRGPRAQRDADAAHRLLAEIGPNEIHLALPAGIQRQLARRLIDQYVARGVTHLLATKVDEVPDDWTLFDLAAERKLPMRWLADGQRVPQDLRSAAPRSRCRARPALRGRRPPSGGGGTSRDRDDPTIVVGSGKGGVGKSVVSLLLATALAAEGRRVLLLDGAQNMGNLHVLLGVRPGARMDALLGGEVAAPELVQAVAPNLWLLAGESGERSAVRDGADGPRPGAAPAERAVRRRSTP